MQRLSDDNYTLLLMYKDYTFLMHLACYNTSSFYFYIKIALTFINILMSSSLSMLYSSQLNVSYLSELTEKSFGNMMIIVKASVVIDLFICISTGILYYFQIAERELFFKMQADNFMKLNNVILAELSLSKEIDKCFGKFVLQEFSFLIENMHFAIPIFVKKNIKRYYHHFHIPPILDVYIHKFGIMTKIKNIKNCLQFLRRKSETRSNVSTVVMSNQSLSPKLSNYLHSISPILKSYSFDSHNVLSKSVYYNFDKYSSNVDVETDIQEISISPMT